MKRYYVIANKSKEGTLDTALAIREYIQKNGQECHLVSDGSEVSEIADCVFAVGGDGTLIRAARELRSHDVPLLGVNMGTLGYLTEVEVQNVEEALQQVMFGHVTVEERMMLKGAFNDEVEGIALNDIVVSRLSSVRMIRFDVYVNGELLNTYQADGMIISTPTGSTAYNLSAGGPIVEPTASMIVVTPICSHALNTSSIVLSAEDEIMIEIGPRRDGEMEKAEVSFDGDLHMNAQTGDRIIIRRAKDTTKLLKLENVSFLEILRRKMKGN